MEIANWVKKAAAKIEVKKEKTATWSDEKRKKGID